MIKCPNCKEAIGDDITTCPFCRHEITDHERILIEKELKEELLSSRTGMSEEVSGWSARRKRWVIISLVLILVFGLSAFQTEYCRFCGNRIS